MNNSATSKAQNNKRSTETESELNKITEMVIGLAILVHKALGPGFVERIYGRALSCELAESGMKYTEQEIIKVRYKGIFLGDQRLDFLIEDEVIVELKAVSEINEIHVAQMLSYLKTANKRLGLILNFAKNVLEIKRVIK